MSDRPQQNAQHVAEWSLSFRAVWITSWPFAEKHAWPGAWVCSAFRNEGDELSSTLITSAKGGLYALQLLPGDMPDPAMPLGAQMELSA